MKSSVTLVIFEGGVVSSELEETLRQIRKAIVIDLIIKAKKVGFERIVLVTSYLDLAEAVANYDVEIAYDSQVAQEFHFGKELLKVVKQRKLEKVLYIGGAAAPLISDYELNYIRNLLVNHDQMVTANNYYSADLIGFTPGSILESIELPSIDNTLPQSIAAQSNLQFIPLQRTLGIQFDLDTPTDVIILAGHPDVGAHTKAAIANTKIDTTRSDEIKAVMQNHDADLVIYGRVGSSLFQLLDQLTRCRIRLYSEERGLKALGRDTRGEGRSLIGEMISVCGSQHFFQFLGTICSGAVIDTRVLFSHFRWELTQSDRFYSDLGMIEKINHPELREFTRQANNAPIPVMLGGHSLVTGGLWALLDGSL